MSLKRLREKVCKNRANLNEMHKKAELFGHKALSDNRSMQNKRPKQVIFAIFFVPKRLFCGQEM